MGPKAKIIADSITPEGVRLTTMEIVCHRFVLAEFNTHRKFSRNSASSRAIPYAKMRERVIMNPAIPLVWATEQKGMQGGEPLDPGLVGNAKLAWLNAAGKAIEEADNLVKLGVHKSIANRLLEPFLWHTIIVSSTEWDNFFSQRCSPLAQPEIQAVAILMKRALEFSTPRKLIRGQWHTPYITERDLEDCERCGEDPKKVSVARCARVSYLTHDGARDVQEDAALFHRLRDADPPHWSPMEHVARVGYPGPSKLEHLGNFDAPWIQLRHT